MFENLKVSTRLSLGFGSAVSLGVAIAAIAALQMNTLSRQIDEITSDRMVKVQQFTLLKDNFHVIARSARNVLISKDPAFEAGEKKKIVDLRVQNSELLAALDKTIHLPKSRELFKTIQDTLLIYDPRLDEALALDAKGDTETASKLLLGEVRDLGLGMFKAVDDSNSFQQAVATELAAKAQKQSSRATAILIALAFAMAALGAAMTWLLVRNLSRALGAEPAELGAIAHRVATGDLSPLHGADKARKDSVLGSLAEMQTNLARIVSQVRASSDSIATGSAQIATGNADLSQRTEEQASNLQQTAASMEQISGTVKTSAETADQANKLASSASAAAVKGGEMVSGVVNTMHDIAASSKKIADIIGVIDGIAFQTNILALNAAVEAARAGEQGRGFAVVASEVRSLAGRSAEAAKEIKTLIGASVEKVEAGTRQVNEAGNSMGEIVSQVQRVNQMIKELSGAASEQASGVGQIGDAVAQLDQVTQQNAALVEESAAAAESLKHQAATLAEVVSVFKVEGGHTMVAGSYKAPAASAHRPTVPAPAASAKRPALQAKAQPAAKSDVKPEAKPAAPATHAGTAAASASSDDWSSF